MSNPVKTLGRMLQLHFGPGVRRVIADKRLNKGYYMKCRMCSVRGKITNPVCITCLHDNEKEADRIIQEHEVPR